MDPVTEICEALAPLDLATCEREPLNVPGSIQPHGVLSALTGSDLRIAAVSAHLVTHLGYDPHTLLNKSLSAILHENSLEVTKTALARLRETHFSLVERHLHASASPWRAIVQPTQTGALLPHRSNP